MLCVSIPVFKRRSRTRQAPCGADSSPALGSPAAASSVSLPGSGPAWTGEGGPAAQVPDFPPDGLLGKGLELGFHLLLARGAYRMPALS